LSWKASRRRNNNNMSSYARGLDILVGTYNYLDLVPKGRDEDALAFTMSWVRHHDRYSDDDLVDPTRAIRGT
jgi:predicted dithiol-disulfide oxidoreductase (DUF899 family)